MLHYKLGDALNYISPELKAYKQKKDLVHYCSATVYMYLQGFIKTITVIKLKKLYMSVVCGERTNTQSISEEFQEIITNDSVFADLISKKSKSEVLEYLNTYKIDGWIICQCRTLLLILPKARLEKDILYFSIVNEKRNSSYKVGVHKINDQFSLFAFAEEIS